MKGNSPAAATDDKVREGLYPYGIKPHPLIEPRSDSTHECFEDRTRELFDRAFAGAPKQRPSALEWKDHLQRLLDGKALRRCAQFPNDPAHIHFADKPCGACKLEGALTARPRRAPIGAIEAGWGSFDTFCAAWVLACLGGLLAGPAFVAFLPDTGEIGLHVVSFGTIWLVCAIVNAEFKTNTRDRLMISFVFLLGGAIPAILGYQHLPTIHADSLSVFNRVVLHEWRFIGGTIGIACLMAFRGILYWSRLARFAFSLLFLTGLQFAVLEIADWIGLVSYFKSLSYAEISYLYFWILTPTMVIQALPLSALLLMRSSRLFRPQDVLANVCAASVAVILGYCIHRATQSLGGYYLEAGFFRASDFCGYISEYLIASVTLGVAPIVLRLAQPEMWRKKATNS